MNERIKQLAKQAGFITIPNTDVIKNKHWGGYMDGSQFEKFAELIVKECAVELMKLGNSYSSCEADADYMQGMLDSADIIKEHFGFVNDD